jgi:hypothetical protein
MPPPRFADLGKPCVDIFENGYNFGTFQLNTSQRTCGGVGIKTKLSHAFEDATFDGSLETSLRLPQFGLTYISKWLSTGYIFNGLSIQDKIVCGLKVGIDTLWSPDTGDKTAIVNGQYWNDVANVELDLTGTDPRIDETLNGSVVLGYQGWLAGAKGTFGANEGVTNSIFALGHSVGDTQAFFTLENGEKYKCSIFQRVTNRLESGIMFGWGGSAAAPNEGEEKGGDTKTMGVAGRYLVDPCSCVRGKFNNKGLVGIGYESKVRDGVSVAVAANVDLKNFSGGGHKVGFGVTFEQ